MTERDTHKGEFRVRSDSSRTRIIVCSEDHVERGGQGASQKFYAPSGIDWSVRVARFETAWVKAGNGKNLHIRLR